MPHEFERDPILEAHELWIANGWADYADGLAAVTSILRVHQVLTRRADQILSEIDLTFSRYEVMIVLFYGGGALPLKRLGQHLQVHQTSITNLVDKLEAQGLVERAPHPSDRRSIIARITPAGRAITRKAIKRLNADLFADLGLTPEETRSLISVLARMRRSWGDFTADPEWEFASSPADR